VLRAVREIPDLGDAEVDELGVLRAVAQRLQHDVLGLQVAMEHALQVRRVQRLADLAHDRGRELQSSPVGRIADRSATPLTNSITKNG
jgi:hypothetical protein